MGLLKNELVEDVQYMTVLNLDCNMDEPMTMAEPLTRDDLEEDLDEMIQDSMIPLSIIY